MQVFLDWLIATSAFGGLVLGVISILRTRSKTNVVFRWELSHEYADVPFLLQPSDFEASLRNGLNFLLPGADDIYAQPVKVRLIIRVERRGVSPVNIESVEIGDESRRVSFAKAPGQVGQAVRTIDPNSHFEWGFDFDSIKGHLVNLSAGNSSGPIDIKIHTGGAPKNRILKAPQVGATEVDVLMKACQKVWPGFPNLR